MWEVGWRREQTAIQSSSDHSSTFFEFWLGCSTVGHWGPKPSVWSWFSLRWQPISNWNWLTSVPLLYFCLMPTCFLCALTSATITEFNHVHRSRWYSDIFHCSLFFRLFTQVYLLIDRLGQGSICYTTHKKTIIIIIVIIIFADPVAHRGKIKEIEKGDQYQDLARESFKNTDNEGDKDIYCNCSVLKNPQRLVKESGNLWNQDLPEYWEKSGRFERTCCHLNTTEKKSRLTLVW